MASPASPQIVTAFIQPRFPPLGNTFLDVPSPGAQKRSFSHPGYNLYVPKLSHREVIQNGGDPFVVTTHFPPMDGNPLDSEEDFDRGMAVAEEPMSPAPRRPAMVPPARPPPTLAPAMDPSHGYPDSPPRNPPHNITLPLAPRGAFGGLPPSEDRQVTTLMIRNLPKTLKQRELLDELDHSGFLNLYDFAYMPCSFQNNESKTFAFVNFISVEAARDLAGTWHRSRRFKIKPSEPALNISPAEIQGFSANLAKWNTPRMQRIRNPHVRPFIVFPEQRGDAGSRVPPSPQAVPHTLPLQRRSLGVAAASRYQTN